MKRISFHSYVLVVIALLSILGFVLAFTVAPDAINMGIGCGVVAVVWGVGLLVVRR